MVNVLQASIKGAAVGGIFFAWAKFTIEAYKTAWHIISSSPKKKLTKLLSKPCVGIAKKFMLMTSFT